MTTDAVSNDLTIDLDDARSTLASVGRRTVGLWASIRDPLLPVPPLAWNVGEVGAHVAVVLRGYTEAANGDHSLVGPFIPPEGTFADRLSAVTAGRSGDERIATPFYGKGAALSLGAATAMLVGEQLIHGYDVATATGRPWPIATPDAQLVVRALTSMMPLAVNPATTAGVHASYQMSIRRGGPRIRVRVDNGTITAETARPGRVDCHLTNLFFNP